MAALEIGAPESYMQLLKEHADIVNLPRIGIDENVAFPVAPTVALKDALGMYNITYTTPLYSYYIR
jgi:hypothetical protein